MQSALVCPLPMYQLLRSTARRSKTQQFERLACYECPNFHQASKQALKDMNRRLLNEPSSFSEQHRSAFEQASG
jgi:hypothetical protein